MTLSLGNLETITDPFKEEFSLKGIINKDT